MKKILALLLAVIMVVSLVACGTASNNNAGNNNAGNNASNNSNNQNNNSNNQPNTPSGPVTLKVWGPAEDQTDGGWLLAMEEAFKEANPDLDITFENSVCSEGEAQGLVTADPSAAGDVYMFANDQLGSLINAGALARLGGAALEQVQADNSQVLIDSVTHVDGNIYGLPVTNNTWFMYYNKTVFSEEDVKNLDTMLTKGKVAFPWGVGWYGGAFFFANGGTMFGNGSDASAGIQFGKANGGEEAALKMVQLGANPNFVDDANGMGIAALKEGTVGAAFSGSWDAAGLRAALGDDLGAVQLPMVEIGGEMKQMKSFAGSKAVGVNPHSANPGIAVKFAAFLASKDAQKARYEMRGVIPAATELANDEVIKADMIAVAEINTMANTAVLQPTIAEMSKFWDPMGKFGGMIVTGDITEENYKEQVEQLQAAFNGESL